MLPTLFLSHGSPLTLLTDSPARDFLSGLGGALPARPRAILVVSAHWDTFSPALTAVPQNGTIHDFHGFPPALYQLRYAAPGAPDLAAALAARLRAAGFAATLDAERGLDHGAWVPLRLAWPQADIPVLQLSLQTRLGPAHHLALGAALETLRRDDILVIGSGSFTHDLSRFRHGLPEIDTPETPDVAAFSAWMDEKILANDRDALIAYRTQAPFAARQHPTEEHLLPLFTALGAAGDAARAIRLHESVEFGFLRMDAYAFQ